MFSVPAGFIEAEYEVKKSRFITRVVPVEDRQNAMQELQKAQRDYADARHYCWAYLLGTSEANSTAAMSDDGEPSGTAGKPILNVIQHKQLGNIMIIVIRYFGGIKLGAGGLVRAYSAAAQQGINMATFITPVLVIKVELIVSFAEEQAVRYFAKQIEASLDKIEYSEKVFLHMVLPKKHSQKLRDQSAAQGWQIKLLEE